MSRSPRPYREFGGWLRSRRLARRWTQEELARRLDYDVTYVRKIEWGERRPSEAIRVGLGSRAIITRPACWAWLPEPTSSERSGGRTPSSSRKILLSVTEDLLAPSQDAVRNLLAEADTLGTGSASPTDTTPPGSTGRSGAAVSRPRPEDAGRSSPDPPAAAVVTSSGGQR